MRNKLKPSFREALSWALGSVSEDATTGSDSGSSFFHSIKIRERE